MLSPAAVRARISRTCASVSLCCGFSTPRWNSPLATAWRTFSCCGPAVRWAGFTHRLLSHECMTTSPRGTGPLTHSYDKRWTFAIGFLWSTRNNPYPRLVEACHVQQPPSSFLTFDQNRSCTSRRVRTRPECPGTYLLGLAGDDFTVSPHPQAHSIRATLRCPRARHRRSRSRAVRWRAPGASARTRARPHRAAAALRW